MTDVQNLHSPIGAELPRIDDPLMFFAYTEHLGTVMSEAADRGDASTIATAAEAACTIATLCPEFSDAVTIATERVQAGIIETDLDFAVFLINSTQANFDPIETLAVGKRSSESILESRRKLTVELARLSGMAVPNQR